MIDKNGNRAKEDDGKIEGEAISIIPIKFPEKRLRKMTLFVH
jgi:hypothetical protein